MYYVDAPTVTMEFWAGTASSEVYFFTFLFTATTYLLAGWAREQVCTYMCPWPRFQSAMLDEQSVTVTYQGWRGEPRMRGRATRRRACRRLRRLRRLCHRLPDRHRHPRRHPARVHQLRPVHRRLQSRDGAHRAPEMADHLGYACRSGGEGGRAGRPRFTCCVRARLIYMSALFVAVAVMTVALAMRSSVGLSVLHDRAPLFVRPARWRPAQRLHSEDRQQGPGTSRCSNCSTERPGRRRLLAEVDEGLGPASRLGLPVKGDSVGTFRITVAGEPGASSQWLAGHRLHTAQHRDRRTDRLSLAVHGSAMRDDARLLALLSAGHRSRAGHRRRGQSRDGLRRAAQLPRSRPATKASL